MEFGICGTEHGSDGLARRLLQTSQISQIPEGLFPASNFWVFQKLSATAELAGMAWQILLATSSNTLHPFSGMSTPWLTRIQFLDQSGTRENDGLSIDQSGTKHVPE